MQKLKIIFPIFVEFVLFDILAAGETSVFLLLTIKKMPCGCFRRAHFFD